MTSPQFLGIQLVCQIVPEQGDRQDEILPDSGRKTTTTAILDGRMSLWIARDQDTARAGAILLGIAASACYPARLGDGIHRS